MSEFFDSDYGWVSPINPNSPIVRLKDFVLNMRLSISPNLRRILAESRRRPRSRVLIVSVEVPGRNDQLADVIRKLVSSTRHEVDISVVPMKPQGKFANIDEAIQAAPRPLGEYDWLVITDDDISFGPNFLDHYLALAEAADLALSQPAHRYSSYASFTISRRRMGSLVRASRFVEIGPITFLRADTFADLVPFPSSRWCYGIDVLWSDIAKRRDWTIGIVDAEPVSHLKPVAATYNLDEAIREGGALLATLGVTHAKREDLLTSWISIPI